MKVTITGYRPEKIIGHEKEIKDWLTQELEKLTAENGTLDCYCGMIPGVDQMFGFAALAANHRLHCVYPYHKREDAMSRHLAAQANSVSYICKEFDSSANMARNKYQIDSCDVLLAVWNEEEAGRAWQMINYARAQGKKIIYMMI